MPTDRSYLKKYIELLERLEREGITTESEFDNDTGLITLTYIHLDTWIFIDLPNGWMTIDWWSDDFMKRNVKQWSDITMDEVIDIVIDLIKNRHIKDEEE